MAKVHRNLIDEIWHDRPLATNEPITAQPFHYAGEKWDSKIRVIRSNLNANKADAIIITSLPEIAYTLNLRGNDYPFTPIFKVQILSPQFVQTIYKEIFFSVGVFDNFSS